MNNVTIGYIDYFSFYESSSPLAKPVLILLFFLWTASLFVSLGLTAKEFFCTNLATISSSAILNLPESVAGVTLAAFGNGAPDLFSTYSAVKGNLFEMAIGELMGAAFVITLGVVGIIAVLKPSKVSRRSFQRDLIFLIIAIAILNIILSSKQFDFAWGVVLFLYYLSYVFVALCGPTAFKILQSCWSLEDLDIDDMNHLRDDGHVSDPFLDDDELSSPNEFEPSTPLQSHLYRSSSTHSMSPHHGTTAHESHIPTWAEEDTFDYEFFMPQFVQRRLSNFSMSQSGRRIGIAPSTISITPSLMSVPTRVSLLQDAPPFGSVEEDILDMADSSTTFLLPKSTLECLYDVVFPLLAEWDALNIWGRIYAVVATPILFFLGSSIPVMHERHFVNPDAYSAIPQEVIDITATVGPDAEEVDDAPLQSECIDHDPEMRLAIIMVKLCISPFAFAFCAQLLSLNAFSPWLVCSLISVLLSLTAYVLYYSKWCGRLGLGRILAFVGFGVAITWIYFISNELVGILDTIGRIFGIEKTLLGLTIFALGNSVGDWVANLTIARMGYSSMAIGACFGGPLLNIVLGLGLTRLFLPGIIVIPSMGTPFWIINGATLVGLVGTFVYGIVGGYVLDERFGYGVVTYVALAVGVVAFVAIGI